MREEFGGRLFQAWEYAVTHGQLLLRSPSTGNDYYNIDIIFSGVKFLHLPTALNLVELVDGESLSDHVSLSLLKDWGSRSKVFVLRTDTQHWYVVAKRVQVRRGFDELTETPIGNLYGFRLNQDVYERMFLAEISRSLPQGIEMEPQLRSDLGFDLMLEGYEKSIGVEIKLMQGVKLERFVRNVVVSTVPLLDKWASVSGILFIVGSEDSNVIPVLKDHLTTALGQRTGFDAVRWLPGESSEEVVSAVQSLLELPGRSASFQ